MKSATIIKRIADLCLVVVLLFLMARALIGEAVHEILGCAMFVLMLGHMAINWTWYIGLRRGTWSAYRILRTSVNFIILACMLFSMVSGMLLSQHVFHLLGITGKAASARLFHLLASYWGFCLMSIHLGMHWRVIAGMILNRRIRFVVNAIIVFVAAYGLIAFTMRGIGGYLFLLTRFVFLDFEEPLSLFMVDYVAIMTLFAFLGMLLSKITERTSIKAISCIKLF